MVKRIAVLVLLGSAAAGQAQSVDQAEEVLARAAAAYERVRTLRSEFVQKIEIPALEARKEGRGVVYQKKPNYFLMKFEEPAGDIVVADGEWFWMYYPSAQPDQVVRTAIERSAEGATLGGQFLVDPTERYVATYVTREDVEGRAAHQLSLVPKFEAPYTLVRVWIDASDYLVRQFEIHEENETVRTIVLRNVEAGAELSDQLFRFSPPEGTEVFTR
ncbi:MAG: outer membrane lipoprotein chaperone LolA [Gemmatimonadota bacterium]|nr:MAG: outer membrane lipoprotein chaperone LolA [Gemmatimonadota bacterium]